MAQARRRRRGQGENVVSIESEKGTVDLEESIAIYARGEALKRHCNDLLKSAEQRIEKITLGSDGHPGGTEPLDVE